MDDWVLNDELFPLRYLSLATDGERGSSGPVEIALCSRLISYTKNFKPALTPPEYFKRLRVVSLSFQRVAVKLLLHLSVCVSAVFTRSAK